MKRVLATGLVAGTVLATSVACNHDLTVPNYQNVTQSAALGSPAAAIPLLATGILRDDRGNLGGFDLGVGILGREAYNYTPTEGRNTSGWLTADVNSPASFGGGALWSGYYGTLRDIYQMRTVANNAPSGVFTAAQLSAINGFLDTEEALQLLYVIDMRDDLGAPVQILPDPTALAPFVSRDSVFNYIAGKLSGAVTELASGGSAFPFTLHAGFAGFNTPSTFALFSSALLARVNAYRASRGIAGCTAKSTTCYATVLKNLQSSFITATASALKTGPFNIYSTAAGDALNSNSRQAAANVVAHAHIDVGIQLRADGTKDLRFTNKTCSIAAKGPSSPSLGIPTTWAYCGIYALSSDPIPIIRNEELLLLRAEAEFYTGDQASALNDINFIRTASGGLAARAAFANEADFLTELTYNFRESLMFEGHRWITLRRFGLLATLPIDSNDPIASSTITPQVIVSRLPIPQGECLFRAGQTGNLAAPAGGGC